MKLYSSIGPNPKVVRMFMAERGISMPVMEVDTMKGENRREAHLKRNPLGTLPTLELDDGTFLAEILPICEYLEEKNGPSGVIGRTPEERAETRMWTRRIDLQIAEPSCNGMRYSEGLEYFKDRIRTIPHAAADLKQLAQDRITWLDDQMAGKQFVCGDRFTLADILLFAFLEFGARFNQPLNPGNNNIVAWYKRVEARPSASIQQFSPQLLSILDEQKIAPAPS
ncbi:glutathione S-transferase family protein [Kineobactrum salinum]|uniref:Glutathione S-transferase n=1 Tax=Kineobactrum salinum TaxID=2708301 RepID=A0A6C0U1B8_9GAMM|nr:glutathione S-transferase [Kineobactrum salinum]QIB65900.1 glutathione S-transferase [Kineobactrum salinum]